MTTHAGAIAAKLQGAHERRTGREDKDMGKAMNSVWDDSDDPMVQAHRLVKRLGKVIDDLATSGHAPGDPQASGVSAERVVELENKLADALVRAEQAEDDRAAAYAAANERDGEHEELRQARELLAAAYVAREVPWSDVAAGMMTIARDGTPWMVESRTDDVVQLIQGGTVFPKAPKPTETVRVLVPYVTPEQAEELVKSELGGRA